MMKCYKKPLAIDELAVLPDEEIDYSNIAELDEEFWHGAELVAPDNKERITLRVDRDVPGSPMRHHHAPRQLAL